MAIQTVATSSTMDTVTTRTQVTDIKRGGTPLDPATQSLDHRSAVRTSTDDSAAAPLCLRKGFPILRPIVRKVGPKRIPQHSFDGWTFSKRILRPTSLIVQRLGFVAGVAAPAYAFMKQGTPPMGPQVTTSRAVTQGPDGAVLSTTETTITAPPPSVIFTEATFAVLGGIGTAAYIAMGQEMKEINDVFWDHWGLTLAEAQRMSCKEIDRYLETKPPLMPQQLKALAEANARLKELNITAMSSQALKTVLPDETAVAIKLTEALAYDIITNVPSQRVEVTMFRTLEGQLTARRLIERELKSLPPEHVHTARAMYFLRGLSSGRATDCINALAVGTKGTGKSHLSEIDRRLFGVPQADVKMAPPVWGGASVLLSTLADPFVQSKFPMNRLVLLGQILFHLYTHRVTNVAFLWKEFNFADQTAVDILKVAMDPTERLSIDGIDMSWIKQNLFNLVMTNSPTIDAAILDRCPFLFHMVTTTPSLKTKVAEDKWDRTVDLFEPESADAPIEAPLDVDRAAATTKTVERVFGWLVSRSPKPVDEEHGLAPEEEPLRDMRLPLEGRALVDEARPLILDYLLKKHVGESARMSVAIAVAVHLGIEALDPQNSEELNDRDQNGKLVLAQAKQIIDQHYQTVRALTGDAGP